MASTNPFDESPSSERKTVVSTNPFDNETTSQEPKSSTNPFDELRPKSSNDRAVPADSTNPFDESDDMQQSGNATLTNPFDDGPLDVEPKASDPLVCSPVSTPEVSTNPFDDKKPSVERVSPSASSAATNPFESTEESNNDPFNGHVPLASAPLEDSTPASKHIKEPEASPVMSNIGELDPPLVKATVIPTSRTESTVNSQVKARSVRQTSPMFPTSSPNSQAKAKSPAPAAIQTEIPSASLHTPLGSAAISVTKVFARLLSVPANRSCADCKSPLVDSSQVHASFSPSLGRLPSRRASESSLGSFQHHHEAFAPPSETPAKRKVAPMPIPKQNVDPAVAVTHYTGGHGVFLCLPCGTAHSRALSSDIATVRCVQGASSSWTAEQVQFMEGAGGNARSRMVYEAYMPESWEQRRPTSNSAMEERELFCRAKYEAMAFVTPLGGPLANSAWMRLLERNKGVETYDKSDEFHQFHRLSIHQASPERSMEHSLSGVELPSRLVDFFCVIGHNGDVSHEYHSSLTNLKSPEKVSLETSIIDCYPTPNSHTDMEFPEHIYKFVYPGGCRPKETRMAPTFFYFVLTSSSGTRLYGAALHVYDESMETDELVEITRKSGLNGTLPSWENSSDIVFMPKCLVVISHYGFFNLWRSFLLQLYRISLVAAPLPIERYITNFVAEVPLPPQGKIVVKFGVTDDQVVSISRPAINELPLADFSYVPLFTALSVENMMVVMGCLMQESQVALVCQQYAMLVPVAEALLSFLFPFEWQGIYIPVMPSSMLDILDAPIPFMVGLHSQYLSETPPERRPHGVVFVDLDNDMVHLGFDPEQSAPRQPPCLPERDSLKLKSKLMKYGSVVYMNATQIPSVKARMTNGNGKLVADSERQGYTQPTSLFNAPSSTARMIALAQTEKAYDDLLTPISGFTSENGQLTGRETPEKEVTKSKKKKNLFRKKNLGVNNRSRSNDDVPITKGVCLLDDQGPDDFSVDQIRNAWLRFFVSIFRNYDNFVMEDHPQGKMFRQESFLNDLDCSHDARLFMAHVTSSQMFQRFVEERISSPEDPFVRFFNESIVAKQNRSKVTTLTTGGKKETPFLDNKSGEIRETFTPAPPSNWGLPDNDDGYRYGDFPKLQPELFGKVRHPKQWPQQKARFKLQRTPFFAKQQEIFSKAMKPLTPVSKMAKKVTKDVEWAIVSLSRIPVKNSPMQALCKQPRDRRSRLPKKPVENDETRSMPDIELRGAEELVVSARRKQGVLIEVAIKVQALCRMHIAKGRYKRHKRSVMSLQRRYRQGCITEETELVRSRKAAVLIQRITRGFLARRNAKIMLKSIVLLQRWVRGALIRKRMSHLRRATLLGQSIQRGRRVRFAYSLLRTLVCKAQARIRGWLARKWVQALVQERMSLYRPHMFELWQRAYTPLAFRTKFWPLAKKTGFLHIHIMEQELERLWSKLGAGISSPAIELSEESKEKLPWNVNNRSYSMFLKVQELLSGDVQEGERSPVLLPAQTSESKLHVKLQLSFDRLQLEKLQIYEKLNSCKDKDSLSKYYSTFNISRKEKSKKTRFIGDIWKSLEFADKSVTVMLSLFPELRTSSDIHCNINPSKKGQRRVTHRGSCELSPLERELDIQLQVDNRIKANMREFATARFNNARPLNEDSKALVEERFRRQRDAEMQVRDSKSWKNCRLEIVLNLLYPHRAVAMRVE